MIVHRKYTPPDKLTVYTIFKNFKLTDDYPYEWNLEGRKSVTTVTSFNLKIEDHFKSSDCTITTPDISKWLKDAR